MPTAASSCVDTTHAQAFRAAMATLGGTVSVITTDGPSGRHGMTATAVCAVSDDPASLLICVNRSARLHEVLAANGVFCVNILAAGQDAISQAFSDRSLSMDERFGSVGPLIDLEPGVPALADAQAALACRVTMVIEAGTHSVFIGHVTRIHQGSGHGALVYYGRRYHHLMPL